MPTSQNEEGTSYITESTTATALTAGDFSCSICMDFLYKPCVNSCGHTFCFWCFHHAMDVFKKKHSCPLCRADFRHFPAVCLPLHLYIAKSFPKENALREQETQKLEREDYKAESPLIDDREKSLQETFHVATAFACQVCSNLAAPPAVLSCGHVVCRGFVSSTSQHDARNCPVRGCVGQLGVLPANDGPTVCAVMEKILKHELTAEVYEESSKVSLRCPGISSKNLNKSTNSKNEDNDRSDDFLNVGNLVIIEGLTSDKGTKLNGCKARIESLDVPSTNRYKVRLVASPASVSNCPLSIKRENLRRVEEEGHVHYGVGCDSCGVYPLSGRRYKCVDCSEEIGFDLCGDCFDAGVHKRIGDQKLGRFNQQHRPDHTIKQMGPDRTIFHQLQEANPDLSLSEIVRLLGIEDH